MSQWIPVTESIPEPDHLVLAAWAKTGEVWFVFFEGGGVRDWDGMFTDQMPSHWMPLPAPPT